MDALRFDALTRALSASSRRGLLGTLLTLPVVGGLLNILTAGDADAKGRRKRRKKRHKHGKGNGRHRKGRRRKRCTPKSRARICAGTCGIVKNRKTCKKKIDCGPCTCDPPCPVCQTCDELADQCVPKSEMVGNRCGAVGEVCQPDGTCRCDVSSCGGETPVCDNGTCVSCESACPGECGLCVTTLDGATSCSPQVAVHCPGDPPQCTSDAECESGFVCAVTVFYPFNLRFGCTPFPEPGVGQCFQVTPCD